MVISRRAFLKNGLIGGSLITVGTLGFFARRPSDLSRAPTGALAILDARTFAVLAAVAERVVPEDADTLTVTHRVDIALQYLPLEGQEDIRTALLLLENGLAGLLTRGSGVPFTALSAEGRDDALSAWADSRIALLRGAFQALRKLCLAAYYAPLSAGEAIGYRGPPFPKATPPPMAPFGPLSPPYRPKPIGLAPPSRPEPIGEGETP